MPEPERIIRKRRRPAHSCVECRRRKVRCDRKNPCGQCVAHHVSSCSYASRVDVERLSHTDAALEPDGSRTQASTPATPTNSHISQRASFTSRQIHGTISKTRIFGHGHWMNSMPLASEISLLSSAGDYKSLYAQRESLTGGEDSDPISQLMAECKDLAREVKKERPFRKSLPNYIFQSLPSHEVIEQLIELHFATFESCYRVLHLSSFRKEYSSYLHEPQNANGSFVIILILILSIAGPLHHDAHIRKEIVTKVDSWINTSQTWLSAPLEKDRLTLKGIQIHCLLLLARQVNRVGADLVWISAGALVRMAMQMGLHQDPDSLREMELKEKEIRRRLWFTILEINAQSSLDSGMAPMVLEGDYTTQPPSQLSDEELDGVTLAQREEILPSEQCLTLFQSVLTHSIGLRLTAARVINSLNDEPSYEEVLDLGQKLVAVCSDATSVLKPDVASMHSSPISRFANSLCSHLLRRFLLCLHFNYAIKAKKAPIYTYSQQVCLEVSLELMSLLDNELYGRLLINGGGMFRDIITRGALVIYLELNSGLESDVSLFAKQKSRSRHLPLIEDAHRLVEYAKNRMYHGETSVKGFVFLSMAAARFQAFLDGKSPEETILKAARDSLITCREILNAMKVDKTEGSLSTDFDSLLNSDVSSHVTSDAGFDFLNHASLDFNGPDWDLFDSLAGENWFNIEE